MKTLQRYAFFIVMLLGTGAAAQIRNIKTDSNTVKQRDTLVIDNGRTDSLKIYRPVAADYQFFTQNGERQIIDTVFTADKTYIFSQYNNRDNFGKIQFSNIGSGFQDLVFNKNPEQDLSLLPTNKSHFIIGIKDVKYYDVKTPTTSFIYHTAMNNGAALNSTYTQNIGKSFNFSVEYMGLRSQGFYQNQLAASNNVVFTGHYLSPNKKYEAFAHYLHQNVNNEENGGVKDLGLFLGGDSRFNNRENLEMNLTDSDSRFAYRRYYFSHQFSPFNVERFPFRLRHTIFHQGNKYWFNLGSADASFYGDLIDGMPLGSKKYSKNLSNTVSLVYDNERFYLDAGLRHQHLKFGTEQAGTEFSENRVGAVGNLRITLFDKLLLKSFLEYSNGKTFGNYLRSDNQLRFEPIKNYFVDAVVNFSSAKPSFNYLLNPSPVARLNYNFADAVNENTLEIGGNIGLNYFKSKLFAKYFRVDNYAYFDADMQPKQSSSSLNISQIGGDATFDYQKFHLNTTLLFQSALTNRDLFPAPNFIGRANIYWQSKMFKNAAEVMAGLKVYYFSKFASREFSPVLNEFILPGTAGYSIGGQPIADVYINMKVKTMMIFAEAQHFNTTFMKNKSFTAPYYPVYDFRLNIGIVWRLFH